MTHGSLFSGIGGFDLAAEWMGWENVFHCEWNKFGQQVLKYYWPNSISYNDITQTDFTIHRGKIDIITGGFPCQPYSSAGKRLGKEDDRHLWPEMLRAIREIQPSWVVGENVLGLVNWSEGLVFHEVQTDLEAEGYEVFPYVLNAASVGAPHIRNRVWFVANTCGSRSQTNYSLRESEGKVFTTWVNGQNVSSYSENIRQEYALENGELERRRSWKSYKRNVWDAFPSVSPICTGDDGLSDRLDSITFPKWRNESIKAGGNAIVPQVVYQIFKAIEEYERITTTKQDY
jgi:DNA (cytosine-5)-methyltransferase 1